MMGVVLRVQWLNLKRDRVAQGLVFLLPIVFYSVFATIFADRGLAPTRRVKVAVVDEDGSEASRRFVAAIERLDTLRMESESRPESREEALALVRSAGDVRIAIILPAGFGESIGDFSGRQPAVELLADTSDPIGPQVVAGMLQKVAATALPDLMIERGVEMFERYAGELTPAQRGALDLFLPMLRQAADQADQAAAQDSQDPAEAVMAGIVNVRIVDVLGSTKRRPMVAYFAAAIAVMFLLFSASGAGGTLLDELECGVLERLLGSQLSMGGLLAGKWLFLTLMGAAQVTLMFLWGALIFELELFTPLRLAGFAVMTAFTAAAASGFGLLLATACRSRAQLGAVSTIVILIMSALGGSMVPRFVMPEWVQQVGYFTFNAWAIDGYQQVFWFDQPVHTLWPSVLVLSVLCVAFLAAARLLARRWEQQ
jgi:ABC-2 type transport system permease protein